MFFVFSAFALGALHALEPGHGKTVVAAYLVGTKGRIRDAIALGGIVTFTHTFSIILLGLLTSVAAAYLVPETVHVVLEVFSGLLIVGVGLWMVNDRILKLNSSHGHSHDADHGDAGHRHNEAEHDHGHDHGHERSHGGHSHSHVLPPGEKASLGTLITLGVSGGIVPCPAALALLLAAVAAGNILGGVSLVIVFSLGLAAVLITIGIAMVKAISFTGRYLSAGSTDKISRRAGAVSAVVVTVFGLVMTARAVIDVASVRLF